MNRMKYIMYTTTDLGPVPVIFPTGLNHNDMHDAVRFDVGGSVSSAGFVDIVDGAMSAHGRSDTLNVDSDPQDSEIINRYLGNDQ